MAVESDAIVVGNGISGLTAAYLLSKKGKKVTLLSPGAIGGMIKTANAAGFILEQGPNVLIEKPAIAALVDELGLRDEVVYPTVRNYKQYISVAGKSVEVPKSPPQFISSQLFSLAEKVRIVKAIIFPGAFRTNAVDASVLDFFSAGLGKAVTRRVFDPVLKGIYGGQIESLSAAALFPQLYQALSKGSSLLSYLNQKNSSGNKKPQIFVFKNGMSTLTKRLLERSSQNTQYNAKVVSVQRSQNGFVVNTENQQSFSSPILVMAIPAQGLGSLFDWKSLGEMGNNFSQQLEKRQYAPVTMVHVSTTEDLPYPDSAFGVLYPEGTAHGLLGIMFNSLLFPHLAPNGQKLLTFCFGGMSACNKRELLTPSNQLISDICRTALNIDKVTVLASHVWQNAIPQYLVGHKSFVESIESIEAKIPGLYLAAPDRGGVGVPDRIKSVMELLRDE